MLMLTLDGFKWNYSCNPSHPEEMLLTLCVCTSLSITWWTTRGKSLELHTRWVSKAAQLHVLFVPQSSVSTVATWECNRFGGTLHSHQRAQLKTVGRSSLAWDFKWEISRGHGSVMVRLSAPHRVMKTVAVPCLSWLLDCLPVRTSTALVTAIIYAVSNLFVILVILFVLVMVVEIHFISLRVTNAVWLF